MKKLLAVLLVCILLVSSCTPAVSDNFAQSPAAVDAVPLAASAPYNPAAAYSLLEPKAWRESTFRYGRSFMSGDKAELYDGLTSFLDAMNEENILQIGGNLPDRDVLDVIDIFLIENPVYY